MDLNENPDPHLVEDLGRKLDLEFAKVMKVLIENSAPIPKKAVDVLDDIALTVFLNGVFAGLGIMLSSPVTEDDGLRKLVALNQAVLDRLNQGKDEDGIITTTG